MTVVFADIEGFTTLAEHRDPESVKELLDACFGRLIPVVERFGGHVDKLIGDEIMATFGAPTAHEDDPERAVRAALALAPALAEVDPALRLRVGVNTGEVLAGAVGPSQGYTVTGDVVNTAHRLAAAAPAGSVLVGERTRRATEEVVDYRLVGDLSLKGKQDRVRAWRAGAVDPGSRRQGPDASIPTLVGRARELAELGAEVRTALAERRAEVQTVVGEAGVGKTRLATELVARLDAGPDAPLVLWASCPPYGPGGDLTPLADLVRAGWRSARPDGPGGSMPEVGAVAAAVAEASGTDAGLLRTRLELLLGVGPVASRPFEHEAGPVRGGVAEHQFGAARAVFAHLARHRPLLLVIDDVHVAGPGLLRFLAQLPDRLAGLPVVVLALGRDDLLERRSPLIGAGPGRSTRTLDPLPSDDAGHLVLTLLGGPAPARMGPAALERLVVATGGNPLLVDQLVRYLVESGALVEVDGRWLWTTDEEGSEAGLPDGVRSLIGARLDSLPDDERSVVADASVLGRRFWLEAVAELGGTETGEVAGLLDRLDRRGLTQAVADDGHGDRAFRHVLTRDVAYASLPIADRAARHARAAAWLERRFASSAEPASVSQLAHHYERAVVLARAVDHTDPGLASAAFAALVRAARLEHRREGLRRADHWFRRARDLGSTDADLVSDVLAEHGQVLLALRQLDAAREAFEEQLRLAGDRRPAAAAAALAHLGAVARLQGDPDLARERFDLAAARWRALGDVAGHVDGLRLQGWSEITAGRPRAALPRLQQAVALEEQLATQPRRGDTLRYLGWCEFLSGELGDARGHLWEAMAHAHHVEDQGTVGWCFGLLAHILLYSGEATRSLEVSRNLRATAARNGDPWGEWTTATLEASALLALGHGEAAVALATEAEARFEELEEPWGLALARLVRAQGARVAGELAEARAVLVRALEDTRDLPSVGEDARLLAELARVELDAGRSGEAERRARAALALVRAGVGDHESGLRSLVVLATVERRRGATAVAELLLEEAAAERAPVDRTDSWRFAGIDLAAIRLDAGDRRGAAELLDRCDDPPSEEVRVRAALAAGRERLAAGAT